MTSSWFFLSTLNYDARSTTHQIFLDTVVLLTDTYTYCLYTQRVWLILELITTKYSLQE